ncbi:MAG: D-alanyl-D-alanine carboxypeptidase family protein [Lachnospiraceae bacterium]
MKRIIETATLISQEKMGNVTLFRGRNRNIRNAAICVLVAFFLCLFLFLFLFGFPEREENELRIDFIQIRRQIQQGDIQPDLNLYGRGIALLDASSGRLLYGENENTPMAMASTTKIMTCILALENCSEDEIVTVSSYAAVQPAVKAGIGTGQSYRLGDLLRAMMLESYNDVAVAIAEHVGGDVANFTAMMNEKALDIGMENTYFITPNGLDAVDGEKIHSSTAYDMALLGRYAMENDTFREIITLPSVTFTDTEGKVTISAINKDAFLLQRDGALGIKTGFTSQAGYCFVGAEENDGICLISVTLGAGWPPNRTWKWSDTNKLMEFGFDNYQLSEKGFLYSAYDDIEEFYFLPLPNDMEREKENPSGQTMAELPDFVGTYELRINGVTVMQQRLSPGECEMLLPASSGPENTEATAKNHGQNILKEMLIRFFLCI